MRFDIGEESLVVGFDPGSLPPAVEVVYFRQLSGSNLRQVSLHTLTVSLLTHLSQH